MTKIPLHLFKTLIAVLLLNLLGIFSASAHEVSPSIADITVTDNQIEIEIRLMAEAVLAEIDLSETTDTNESARVAEYDRFRALEAQALAEAVRLFWPSIQTRLHLWAAPARQDLALKACRGEGDWRRKSGTAAVQCSSYNRIAGFAKRRQLCLGF
jgi:hypothetical protein